MHLLLLLLPRLLMRWQVLLLLLLPLQLQATVVQECLLTRQWLLHLHGAVLN
jgi:hypothetical protein